MSVDLTDPRVRQDVVRLVRAAVASGAALGWVEPPPPQEVDALLHDVAEAAGRGDAGAAVERRDGRVVGFGYWRRYARPTHGPQADVERVLVEDRWRGHGHGRALLRSLVASATAAGVEVLTLDVRGDNHGAITLYEQEGFTRYGVLPRFVAVGDQRFDKVLMARRLDAPPAAPAGSAGAAAPWGVRTDHLVGWAVLRRGDGRVLLARRSAVSYAAGLWGLPGGHVEDDETLAAGTARELHEEVGVVVRSEDLVPLAVTRYAEGSVRGTSFFFVATRWQGDPQPLSECSEVGWFAPDDLPADALPWLAAALRTHLLEGRWLSDHPAPSAGQG